MYRYVFTANDMQNNIRHLGTCMENSLCNLASVKKQENSKLICQSYNFVDTVSGIIFTPFNTFSLNKYLNNSIRFLGKYFWNMVSNDGRDYFYLQSFF